MLPCTGAAAVILARAALPASWPRLSVAALATVCFVPATFNLRLGQMEPLVLLVLALAFVSYVRGHRVTCGVLIGVAASLKLAPLLLVILLLRRRWWHAAAATGATVAVSVASGVIALGASPLIEYVTRVMPAFARQDGWIYNQSVNGVLNRLADHSVLTVGTTLMPIAMLSLVFAAIVVAVAAGITRPGQRSSSMRGVEFACAVMAMLL